MEQLNLKEEPKGIFPAVECHRKECAFCLDRYCGNLYITLDSEGKCTSFVKPSEERE